MKKTVITLVLLLTLVSMLAAPALAQVQENVTASVTVSEVISFTVNDHGDPGINFGERLAGATDQPELAQTAGQGAVTLELGSETNIPCALEVSGSGPFSDGGTLTIPLAQAKWHAANLPGTAFTMTTSWAFISRVSAGTATEQDVWHWISIPTDTPGGTYTTTFYYRAARDTGS